MTTRASPRSRGPRCLVFASVIGTMSGCLPSSSPASARPDRRAESCDDACTQRHLQSALTDLERGRTQAARERLEDLYPRPPMSDPTLRLVLALLALEAGDPTQAMNHAEWLATHAPSARIAAKTCRILVRLSKPRRASTLAQQRINEGVVSPALYLELSWAWEAQGQEAAAMRGLQEGLDLFPNDPALLETAAARADAAGDLVAALDLYTRAIPHHPSPELMHEAVARVATQAEQHELAIRHARLAVAMAGDRDAKLYRVLHDALLASGDVDGARGALERGRRRFPQATILGEP